MNTFQALEGLVLAHGPSGMEDEVRDRVVGEVKELADELIVDKLGNLIAVKHGNGGPRVMLDAHMDEVGVAVKHIDEDGWIWFEELGFINEKLLQGQRVTLSTRSGPIPGVVGAKGRHLTTAEEATKATPVKEMWIDIGASSVEEAEGMGVRVGDLGTFEKRFSRLGKDLVCATSLDDRVGCLAVMGALRRLEDPEATVYAVFTVQEEVGCRGARATAHRINPDLALVVDTTYGEDPATSPMETRLKIGDGPSVRALERSAALVMGHITPRHVFDYIIDAADEEDIPYQREVSTAGATDASTVHLAQAGIPTGTILIARRYSHSPIEVASIRDVEGATDLLTAVVGRLDESWYEKIEAKLK
jgi:endoglucanase